MARRMQIDKPKDFTCDLSPLGDGQACCYFHVDGEAGIHYFSLSTGYKRMETRSFEEVTTLYNQ
jgi:hypothetical protein